jgi:putative endopeptidase
MKPNVFRSPLALALLLAWTVATAGQAAEAPAHGVDPAKMDRSANACADFYLFANGTWLANSPIPADRTTWGAGSELYERNLEVLHAILEDAARDTAAAKDTVAAKVGAFYRSGMDTARIDKEGVLPLSEELLAIEKIAQRSDLPDVVARLHRQGVGPAFQFGVLQDFKNSSKNQAWLYQGGLGLPDRDYYVTDDKKKTEIRNVYVGHVAKILELSGESRGTAAAHAKTILAFETRLAKVSMTPVEQRDPQAIYHPMTPVELAAAAPGFAWDRYFTGIGLKDSSTLNIGQPAFFQELGRMASTVPLPEWKAYLRWHLLHAEAGSLSSPFVEENFRMYGKTIGGAKQLRPRWKRVLQSTDQELGEALGQLYVAHAFPPEAKARAREMVGNLIAALRDRITALDWIEEATRQQALRKVDAIVVKVGYPDRWRDYARLPVDRGSYAGNVMQAEAFEFDRNLRKIGQPVDRTEWGITAPTVDAYYNPQFNEIVFPAGILQPPFFDPQADDESNYGAIGAVIGHELTHGFDDQGHQFDADGNLKSWWTPQDEKNYAARAEKIEKQYSGYVAVDAEHVNGKLTLGENIADLGGLKIAYLALQKAKSGRVDAPDASGFTSDQRFFLSFAQSWRSNSRPETLRLLIATDPHSPSRFRVLGPTSNLAEFARAFNCKPAGGASDTMSVSIW